MSNLGDRNSPQASKKMTAQCMIRIIEEHGNVECRDDHIIEFIYEKIGMTLIYDEEHDRMRILAGICRVEDLHEDDLEKAMEANFHSCLDARYATGDGVVWAAFIHPISCLSSTLFLSAIRQVAIARVSFGAEFTSGIATFGSKKSNS